jgi:hypothetical protein
MGEMVIYGHFNGHSKMVIWSYGLRYIHHTGLLGRLNQHQSHQLLQYFAKVLDDPDRNIICDHIDQMPSLSPRSHPEKHIL